MHSHAIFCVHMGGQEIRPVFHYSAKYFVKICNYYLKVKEHQEQSLYWYFQFVL